MNREQAEEILEYLLEAAFELDEARAAANVLADQDKDAAALSALIIKLNSELLQAIYARFRDLIPFEEFPAINSSLRWDQVQLPPSVSEAQVDQIILSVIAPQWHKMARIIWDAVKRSEELALGVRDEAFAARIQVLVEAGHVESQGDLRKWRHSEVRKKLKPLH
jgi:transposase